MNHPTLSITIGIESYWHTSSGQGIKGDLDSMVVRDDNNLPYIPGRTIKGLLRDACYQAETFGQVQEGTTDILFGSRTTETGESSIPGTLLFSSANLPDEERDFFAHNPEHAEQLYDSLASTKIDEDGLADNKKLRIAEVTIPMTLHAKATLLPGTPEHAKDTLAKSAPLIRALGTSRSRGFGRCTITIK